MRPKLELLDKPLIERILDEAFQLIEDPGVRVAPYVEELLRTAGITVKEGVAHIPEVLARRLLDLAPRGFCLYDRLGKPAVHYTGDTVHFDPGSSCLNILDPDTQQPRAARSGDLVRFVQVTEMLPQFTAQSTAMVCNDVPQEIGDWYRLLLVLWYSEKPVVTGAFSAASLHTLIDLLAIESGGREHLRRTPRAIFDVCPSPPLNWSEFASQNLVDLARAAVPAEIVSMPLAGATAPVTLVGSVVQHAAECISGITIHQLAAPGAPIVWGGAPAIFDMRTGKTPMGAIETAMLDVACSQVGKYLGLPTHAYLVAGDGRVIDAQVEMESGMSAALGALAGINMISGAGMLDFLACHSIEKLVIDAEAIASAQRLIEGIQPRGTSLAVDMFAQTGLQGDFLRLKDTRALFRKEQHFPSAVIDRGLPTPDGASPGILERAHRRVQELISTYERHPLSPEVEKELIAFAQREARPTGLDGLPGIMSHELTDTERNPVAAVGTQLLSS
jgi:trimethylamine---corrinoid protein Co-methyltransferase